MEVLKAWDYAQTIFRSEKLRIAYIKPEIGTGKHIFDVSKMIAWLCALYVCCLCIMTMYLGYVSRLSIMAMYHGYVSWLCILAMYHGYVSLLCIMDMSFEPESRSAVAFWAKYLISCESKVACKFWEKVPECFKSRFDTVERKISTRAFDPALNNILVAKQWTNKNPVPMSYISL